MASFLKQLDLTPIILHEQADEGKTIIEKFEHQSLRASFAIVLFSPDDIGYPVNHPENEQLRPRQNVVFELGYFLGKLSRNNVRVLLKKGFNFEIMSDFSGVIYKVFDDSDGWQLAIAKELKAAGFEIDMNNL